ncbi:MAG: lysophospholipid acyltransferase family protein [Verrucomicrobiae bacterium]|nr:lysophospholipid acyltransferase family protein [Verrucomicrobiae bacterium]NNJ43720.1 lysophospholipid acyltransferase family protein [Akkermansiaceae bacterium]
MNKNSNNPSPSLGDSITYGIYRVFEFVLRLLPMEVVCVIGSGFGQIAYHLMNRRRNVVLRNLRIVYGEQLSMQEIKALTRKTFRHTGQNLIASIPASTLSDEELKQRVEVVGREHFLEAQNQGNGCILLLAHMGNWEILTQLKVLIPEIDSLASLYRPLNNPLLDRLVKRRRQSKDAKLYSREDGFAKPITHLKLGGSLGCIADQSAGKHGVTVSLFGKQTSMTNLPALLHRKTKAPILPISMCSVFPGKWKVVLHPLIEVLEENKRDTYQITTQCADAYEKLMKESPADVLWMHNYWRGGKRTALKIRGQSPRKANLSPHHSSQPFYVLAHSGSTISDEQLAKALTYLRACRPDLNITLTGHHSEFPHTDHCLPINAQDPPHLAVNALSKLEDAMPAPFDCALDFSDDKTGIRLFTKAGIRPQFALSSPPKSAGHGPMPAAGSSSYDARLDYFIQRISSPPPPTVDTPR